MPHRGGGKITASHTTMIELVDQLVDFLEKHPDVTKITLGVITPLTGKRSSSAWLVKLFRESPGCVLARAIQKGSVQEFRFYAVNAQDAMLATSRFIRDNGWELRFK